MYKIICNQEGDINYGIDQSSSRCIWRNNGRSVEGVFLLHPARYFCQLPGMDETKLLDLVGGQVFGGTMADQWKEFFYCDAIDKDVLVVKGEKRVGGRSSNKKGSDNIISSGSGIAVADGQCMIIVEQGKVVEVCAEPGQFTYDASTEPSIFAGSLGEGIHRTFDTVKKRFTFGGDTGKDQRVYYFNTKELVDNKFGTANPIPFRVVDRNIGLDIDVSVRCNGVYSYKIVDPLLFYTNVCGNVEQQYDREEIEGQLKTEFVHIQNVSLPSQKFFVFLPPGFRRK